MLILPDTCERCDGVEAGRCESRLEVEVVTVWPRRQPKDGLARAV